MSARVVVVVAALSVGAGLLVFSDRFSSWAGLIVPIGFLAAVVWRVISLNRGARLNNTGLSLLGQGRLVEALELFKRASSLMLNALPRFNRGMTELWLWRVEEARIAIDSATRSISGRPLRVVAVPTLCFIASLQADRQRFESCDAEARALSVGETSMVAVARAVWAAREGRWGDVLKHLNITIIRPLGGPSRAVAEALRSWAREQLGQGQSPVDRVGIFGESGPQALSLLWPEFVAFLERAQSW